MLKYILSLTAVAAVGFSANAEGAYVRKFVTQSPMDIASLEMTTLNAPTPAEDGGNNCSSLVPTDIGPIPGIDWGTIVNIGEKIWQIVEANKPVVTVNTPVANALPRGLTCWTDLEHWHAPFAKTYEVTYKNGFGSEVVKFRFNLQYNFGGGKGGVGQYIANATIVPLNVQVDWAYTFDATVVAGNIVNMGSLENPMAGFSLNINWTVKTALQENREAFSFFIQGDGTTILNN